jgi:ferredoxin-NADP reductase
MKLTLVEIKDEAKGTKSFYWKPEKPITYVAGQYFYFTLPKLKYPDPRGATRHFTLSSSPTEGETIRLTTRIREESGYKKTLNELAVNRVIEGEGPEGTFILDENEKGPFVFLAGGIGITPFRSMLKFATDKKLPIPIHLIYSNSIPEEIAFKDELESLSRQNPNFKLSMTVSKPEQSGQPWSGLTGRIDEMLIKKLFGNWKLEIGNSTFLVAGPPPMVDAIEQMLGKLGLPAGRLRSEKFTGY